MGYNSNDIRALSNPSIKCGDSLNVYIKRKDALITGIVSVSAILFLMILVIINGFYLGCIVLTIMLILVFLAFRNMYFTTDPTLIIDENGLTFDKETYKWQEIEKIIFEDNGAESSDYLRVHLKNNKKASFMLDSFLDQSVTAIATQITKYYKN
jgi:hypothetical protein